MFHEKLSSSYRRWLFGWRTAAWLAHCRLAGALPLGWRTTAWLAHCRLAGALPLGRRAAAWLAHYRLAGALLLGPAHCSGNRRAAGPARRCSPHNAASPSPLLLAILWRIVVLEAVTRVASCADRLRRDRMTESFRTFEAVGDGEGQKLVAAGRRKTTGCGWLSGGGYLPVAAESDEGRPTCSESAAGSSWCSSLSVRLFSALRT